MPQVNSDATPPAMDWPRFWTIFRHRTVPTASSRLHYVEGGQGPATLLIPGWPQTWYAWRYVMPRLAAAGRRVIAIDPRGFGESGRPTSGYDVATVAAEIRDFVTGLNSGTMAPIDVVGHDVGAWIAYAYAADWPQDVGRLAILDTFIPGLSLPRADISPEDANLRSWHFAFNQLPDLPEILISGREHDFLTWLFRSKSVQSWSIGRSDLEEYARQLASPGAIRAAAAYYRAAFSPVGLEASRARAKSPLPMPVLALGADNGTGASMLETMRTVAADVQGSTIAACGHYMPEEQPDAVSQALIGFFESRPSFPG
jgi:pimeloyl-ACP methyl ester carboxylesterase